MIGSRLTMRLAAAERATQIFAPGVTRVGGKENAAMPALSTAKSQRWAAFKNRSQQPVILKDQSPDGGGGVVPLGTELKVLLDRYCKKP